MNKNIIEKIKLNPSHINDYDLNEFTLDNWAEIFYANSDVATVLPIEVFQRKEIQVMLVSHSILCNFNQFDCEAKKSKHFVILCLNKGVHFSLDDMNKIMKDFDGDEEIIESAFKTNNLKGCIRNLITEEMILNYAKTAEYPNYIGGDFDLQRLPTRFKKDKNLIEKISQIIPNISLK